MCAVNHDVKAYPDVKLASHIYDDDDDDDDDAR